MLITFCLWKPRPRKYKNEDGGADRGFTFRLPKQDRQLTARFIAALLKDEAPGDTEVEQHIDLPNTRHGENNLAVSLSLRKPSPIPQQKPGPAQSTARSPSRFPGSATGVGRSPFTHFSDFARAGRKNKRHRYAKKCHRIWSELRITDDILLFPEFPLLHPEFCHWIPPQMEAGLRENLINSTDILSEKEIFIFCPAYCKNLLPQHDPRKKNSNHYSLRTLLLLKYYSECFILQGLHSLS